jgi:hypothetical protein
MKNLILTVIITLCTITTYAQPAQYTPMTAAGYQMKRLKIDSTLHLPSFCGVPTIRGSVAKDGALAIDTCGGYLYMWTNQLGWDTINVTVAGGGGNQDLQSVLNNGNTSYNKDISIYGRSSGNQIYLSGMDNNWMPFMALGDSIGGGLYQYTYPQATIDFINKYMSQKLKGQDSIRATIYLPTQTIDATDTLAKLSDVRGVKFDSTSLSNRINSKLSISDTASMLSSYNTRINGKLNIADTANKFVNRLTRTLGKDSIIYFVGANRFAIKDSVGSNPAPVGYYGAFQDNTSQTAVSINTAYAVKLNTTDLTNGVSVVNDGSSNPTRITLTNTGIYNIQFSLQLEKTGGSGNMIADIWIRKNGVDIPSTTGKVVLTGSANASPVIAAWNYVLDLAAGDYIQLMWATSNTNVEIIAAVATSPHPAIPSAILTVTQQSGIMAGTGITAINSLTGAAQTMVTGTDSTDFKIVSTGTSHKFNLPTASATKRGALSTTDWTTFNSKLNASDTSVFLRKNDSSLYYTKYRSDTSRTNIYTAINGKQATLINPVTGTGTNNQIAYFNSTGSTISSLSTGTYPSLTELSYVKGVTSSIQTQIDNKLNISDTSTLQRKSIPAYSILANNTNVTANATAQYFKDTSGTYTGTITWNGTAPTSGNLTYRWTRFGKMVTINISLVYANAGAANSTIVVTLPADAPTPTKPGGLTSASNLLFPCFGGVNTTNQSTLTNSAFRGFLRNNAANNGFEFTINHGAITPINAFITCTYFTD